MANILVTGGAGFLGTNFVDGFAAENRVVVLDNFSRKGCEKNLQYLLSKHKNLKVVKCDIRNFETLKKTVDENDIDIILHAAAQVAVTASVENPKLDFEINALGSLNVLEAARISRNNVTVLTTSTNKVYGGLENVPIKKLEKRYDYDNLNGVNEEFPLTPHTPYGVSKAAADTYTQDYFCTYGLPTIVFRQSCIYGPFQHGLVDQGWVDYITRQAVRGETITVFGDGFQVRDILFVSDLVRAAELAIGNIHKTSGQVFNIGGGKSNTLSLLELVDILQNTFKLNVSYKFSKWRPSDQKVFYCDLTKAKEFFGWEPKVSKEEGLTKLFEWVKATV